MVQLVQSSFGNGGLIKTRKRQVDLCAKATSRGRSRWMGGWAPGDCNGIDLRQATRRRKHLAQMKQWAR